MACFSLRKLNITLSALCLTLVLVSNSTMANENKYTNKNGETAAANECVIVLHGLARTAFSMRKVVKALKPNYKVINNTYPSRKKSIEELAELAIAPAIKECESNTKIHFVTHSLGGILVRQYLSQHEVKSLGNVVMLGPPNNGSEIVDRFKSSEISKWFFTKVNGPAGEQLGTGNEHVPTALGAVNFNLGVIAGNVSYSPVFSKAIDGEDDGKVSVESSKIAGMKDHIVLPVSHTFMMRSDEVVKQVKHFLKEGVFLRLEK